MVKLFCTLLPAAVLAAATVAPSPAGDGPALKIEGATKVTPPELVRLRATGYSSKAALLWRIHPRDGVHRATTASGLLEFAARPGTYTIELVEISTSEGSTQLRETSLEIVVGAYPGSTPKPPPAPEGKADPAKATMRISFGRSGCTATVVGPRRADGRWDVLTAAHCTGGPGDTGTLHVPGSKGRPLEVVSRTTTPDLSWMVCDFGADIPPYAVLAKDPPPIGTKVWHKGFGVDRPGNLEEGEVTSGVLSSGMISFKLSVSSGDSGSGIFRTDNGELVAVVCCTSGMGKRVTMYGGASVTALRLRPASESIEGTIPIPIPFKPEM